MTTQHSPVVRRQHLDIQAALLLVFLCALWGFNQVTIKLAIAGISPVMQAGLRSVIATLLLLIWTRLRRIRLFDADRVWIPGLAAGIMFALEFALLYYGLQYTSASRAIVFLYMAPFVVTLGMHWLVPAERLSWVQNTGMLLAFVGVLVIFSENIGGAGGKTWLGDLLAFGAAVFWGLTTLTVRMTRLAHIAPSRTLFYQLAVSALILPCVSALMGEPGVFNLTPLVLACLLFQGVVVAFASYMAWFWLIARYPVSILSGYTFVAPVFGVIAGVLVLGEPVTGQLIGGAMLVAAGIYMVNRRNRRHPGTTSSWEP